MSACLVIDAEGYHGDYVTVWSEHATEAEAFGAAKRGGKSVRAITSILGAKKGDKIAARDVRMALTALGARVVG